MRVEVQGLLGVSRTKCALSASLICKGGISPQLTGSWILTFIQKLQEFGSSSSPRFAKSVIEIWYDINATVSCCVIMVLVGY